MAKTNFPGPPHRTKGFATTIQPYAPVLAIKHLYDPYYMSHGGHRNPFRAELLAKCISYSKWLNGTESTGLNPWTFTGSLAFHPGGPIAGEGYVTAGTEPDFASTDSNPDLADWTAGFTAMFWASGYGTGGLASQINLDVQGSLGRDLWDLGYNKQPAPPVIAYIDMVFNDLTNGYAQYGFDPLAAWHQIMIDFNPIVAQINLYIDNTIQATIPLAFVPYGPDPTNFLEVLLYQGWLMGPTAVFKPFLSAGAKIALWNGGAGLPFPF